MKLINLFLKASCCVVIGLASIAVQASVSPVGARPGFGHCNAVNSAIICVDSLAPNYHTKYPLNALYSCVINPNYNGSIPIPPSLQAICNGVLHDGYQKTMNLNLLYIPVADSNALSPMFYVTEVIPTIGACKTTLQGANLANVGGNIYSCNQSTGVFTVHR